MFESWLIHAGGRFRESQIGQRYHALNDRERTIVNVGIGLVLATIFYLAIFGPIYTFHDSAVTRYQAQRAQLDWMQTHEADARRQARGSPTQRVQDQSLLALVASTAREFNVRLTRYQPESSGGVSVVIQQQSFNDVLRWTQRLTSRHQIQIIQASVDAHGTAGLVNARFSIR